MESKPQWAWEVGAAPGNEQSLKASGRREPGGGARHEGAPGDVDHAGVERDLDDEDGVVDGGDDGGDEDQGDGERMMLYRGWCLGGPSLRPVPPPGLNDENDAIGVETWWWMIVRKDHNVGEPQKTTG